ncbi:hypothetical protein, partial [Pseudoalteromonas sp. DSM 26666]|uniref:hypothetical protein n=1 Tax=Pseudoalteromonas sp. DSM 26666 TaxID=1761892 RepID=UPI001C31D486
LTSKLWDNPKVSVAQMVRIGSPRSGLVQQFNSALIAHISADVTLIFLIYIVLANNLRYYDH